ncbi:hypothetical protein BGZ97_003390 [Linnemannia gamsii]|uniref:F-box domain-containing protein n=1 Tax=Linnemannia gamsii TaxID=64522 RepID=A0A9P6RM62_9FUNG|nr:hypothetical protein BGZ97_003390 [Linnemannia gamsii]
MQAPSFWRRFYLRNGYNPASPTTATSVTEHSNDTQPLQQRQRRISPLDIPEILQRIFFFVDNGHTLSRTVILVCKDWFIMNKHRVIRDWVWDSDRKDLFKLEKHLAKLTGAGRVRLHYGWGSKEDRKEAIRKTLALCQDQFDRRQYKRDRALQSTNDGDNGKITIFPGRGKPKGMMRWRPILDSPLQELELRGAEVYQALPELLPSLRYLTRFHFGTTDGCYVEVDKILEACPLLERLYVGSSSDLTLIGSLVTQSHIDKGSLRLRSFTLENPRISQADIEDLISAAPLLDHVQLIGLRQDTVSFREHVQYDRTQIMAHITTLQRTLSSFHFSLYDEEPLTEKELQEIVTRICPRSQEWTFWSPSLTPVMMRCLNHLPNVVTSLELNHIRRSYNGVDCALHRYLCTSPSLLHLKVPKSAYLFDHLDLHRRLHYIHSGPSAKDIQARPYTETTGRLEIWACRRLQTLWMAFHNQGVSLLVTPTHSRILFGYLSRVCPQLVDVRIFAPEIHVSDRQKIHPMFELRLHGGFCLLARLQNLETLQLHSFDRNVTYSRHDLSWMLPPSKLTSADRAERKKMMFEWVSWMEVEKTQEEWQRSSHIATLDWGDTPPELVRDLQHLGMLMDVTLTLQEIESKDYRLWPRRPRISVGPRHGFGYQAETFVQSFTWDK